MTDVDLYTWTKPDGVRYHFRDDRLSWLYQREGDIYISADPTSPAEIFGGEWERITGRFLLGTDTTENDPGTYPAGSTGGEATHSHSTQGHALTASEIPSHHHSYSYYTYQIASGSVNRRFLSYSGSGTWDSGNTGGGGSHSHGDTGSSSNMPPYLAVYMWKRIA